MSASLKDTELPHPDQDDAAPPEQTPSLSAAAAMLLAWGFIAAFHVVELMVATANHDLTFGQRLLLHLFATGQVLAMGLLSYVALRLWGVSGARRVPALGYPILWLLTATAAALLIKDDIASFAQRQGGTLTMWRAIGGAVVACGLTGAAFAHRWLKRRPWRIAGAVASILSLLALRHFVPAYYPQIHLFGSWFSAILLASSLHGATFRAWPSRKVRTAALGLVSVYALATLAIRPPRIVWAALFSSPGAVVAPLLADVDSMLGAADEAAEPSRLVGGYDGKWFVEEGARGEVPPTGPALVDDGIILFITIDAVRADLVADPRYADKLATLHSLKQQSVDFTRARAPSPGTSTTYQSIFRGKYYSQLRWTPVKIGKKFVECATEDDSPSIPEVLTRAGVDAVDVVGIYGLLEEQCGVDGFEEHRTPHNWARARSITDLLIKQIDQYQGGRLLLYTHYVDAHNPYNRGGRKGSPFDRYLAEVALVDGQLSRLRRHLISKGLEDKTTWIVSADHGEAFGEHGASYHSSTVYEEMVRVPLLIHVPGVDARAVDAPVSLIDIGPTLFDLLGLPTPPSFMGQSLVPFLRGEAPTLTRPLIIDSGRRMQALIFPDGVKVIHDVRRHTFEVYDLEADPNERHNLISEVDDARLGTLDAFFRVQTYRADGYTVPYKKW